MNKGRKELCEGLKAVDIIRLSGVCRASFFNWRNGGGKFVAFAIETAINKLQSQNKNHERNAETVLDSTECI